MNPILEALLKQILQAGFDVLVPFLLNLFKHTVALSSKLQALPKEELRAQARAWVKAALEELGQKLVAKGVVPGFLQPFLPLVESIAEQAIESALDAAGL